MEEKEGISRTHTSVAGDTFVSQAAVPNVPVLSGQEVDL